MRKETLKDWCKVWSVKDIITNSFSSGMQYMSSHPQTDEEAKKQQRILTAEINRRIRNK